MDPTRTLPTPADAMGDVPVLTPAEMPGMSANTYDRLIRMIPAIIPSVVDGYGTKFSDRTLASCLKPIFSECGHNLADSALALLVTDWRNGGAEPQARLRRELRGNESGNSAVLGAYEREKTGEMPACPAADIVMALRGVYGTLLATKAPQWPVEAPSRAKANGKPPKEAKERTTWDEANLDAAKQANKKRDKFSDATINSIVAAVVAEPRLQGADWNEAQHRPLLIRRAIHGAVQHACVLYAHLLAPDALKQADKKVQPAETLEDSLNAILVRVKGGKESVANGKSRRVIDDEIAAENDDEAAKGAVLSDTSERLADLKKRMEGKVAKILLQRCRGTNGQEIADLQTATTDTFAEILETVAVTVETEAHSLFNRKNTRNTKVEPPANGQPKYTGDRLKKKRDTTKKAPL